MNQTLYRLLWSFVLVALGFTVNAQSARVQLVHNSPDTALASVDIWVDNSLAYSGLNFREASPYTSIPVNTFFDITITAPGAIDTTNGLFRVENFIVTPGDYVAVAAGTVSPGYNPAIPFNLYFTAGDTISAPGTNDILIFHGSTDAPGVDVVEVGVGAGTVGDNLEFGDFNPAYISVPNANYVFSIQDSTQSVVVAEYSAPLAALGLSDTSLVVVASGFLDPSSNNNGAAFGLFAATPGGGPMLALPQSTAPVQVIHNCADTAAAIVDVWVNNAKAIPNFVFRTATPFVDLPTGVNLDISITAPNSVDTTGAVFRLSGANLAANDKYIIVASGDVSVPTATPFGLSIQNMAREEAGNAGETDVLVFHGSTDAPGVDVVEVGVGAGTIIDNLEYGNFQGYANLPTDDYVLSVQDSTQNVIVREYNASLASFGLQDSAIVVLASGFLDPASAPNGNAAFGLWVAIPSGGQLVQLPESTVPVQVIHNSADLAADTVDVWYNNLKIIPNFAFRTASPFVNLPSGVSFDISITLPNSVDTVGAVYREDGLELDAGAQYTIIANGIVSPSGYSPNTPFELYIFDNAQLRSDTAGNTDVRVFHGATDAPAVRVNEVGVGAGNIISGLSYGNIDPIGDYLELATDDYVLQVEDNGQTVTVGEYLAPLQTLGLEDSALVVLASGFLDPSVNSSGPGFGLWAALPQGGPLVQLPTATTRAQVIHNSADLAADTVDVWLNNTKIIPDFAFRTATPFVDLPTGVNLDISVTLPGSVDTTGAVFRASGVNLSVNSSYIIVADGIVSPGGYSPSPAFGLSIFDQAREEASMAGMTDVLVYHGVTDAPPVDVNELAQVGGTLIDNLLFREFRGYTPLNPLDYVLSVADSSNSVVVGEYLAPLQTLGLQDSALTILASGFLDTSLNSGGAQFGLWVALPEGGPLVELPTSTAPVQVIHNAADVAADTVDVWYNDQLLINDFAFRTATPFVDLPTGVGFDLSITGPNAADTAGAVFRAEGLSLFFEETYTVIANGIVDSPNHTPFVAFDLYAYPSTRMMANMPGNTDVQVFHGVTDAPAVDVEEVGVGAGIVVDNLEYGDFIPNYLMLATDDYVLKVMDSTGSVTVGVYEAPLQSLGLGGQSISVVASGFLNPAANNNGPGFGLWVALNGGGPLVELPTANTSIQILHNSSDAAADTVDVWINGNRAIPNFAYRTATPVLDLPANVPFTISITGPGAADTVGAVFRAEGVVLDYNMDYLAVANGIVSPTGYFPAIPFGLSIYDDARFEADQAGNTDMIVHHGGTDAPAVDVYEIDVPAGRLVDNLSYGAFDGYLELGNADYVVSVRDSTNSAIVGEYLAPLASLGLADSAVAVVASGFLSPGNNSGGPAFGLFAVLPAGGPFIELPRNTAPVQIIHNSADLAAATVDIWVNDVRALPFIPFRAATNFLPVPTGIGLDISITAPGAPDTTNAVYRAPGVTFTHDSAYIIVANGIVSPTGYTPNVPFELYIYDQARLAAETPGNTDILVFHGSTDAPTVDITEPVVTQQVIVDDLQYGTFRGYLPVPAFDIVLGIEDSANTTELFRYQAPLATLGLADSAITVLASGFVDSTQNSDGASFGLWVAQAAGGLLIPLPEDVGSGIVDVNGVSGDWSVYPNPTEGPVNVDVELSREGNFDLRVFDLNGQIIFERAEENASQLRTDFDFGSLQSGIYILEVIQDGIPVVQTPIVKK